MSEEEFTPEEKEELLNGMRKRAIHFIPDSIIDLSLNDIINNLAEYITVTFTSDIEHDDDNNKIVVANESFVLEGHTKDTIPEKFKIRITLREKGNNKNGD